MFVEQRGDLRDYQARLVQTSAFLIQSSKAVYTAAHVKSKHQRGARITTRDSLELHLTVQCLN